MESTVAGVAVMSARLAVDNTRPEEAGLLSDLTPAPAVQRKLDAAARAIRLAIARVEAAREATEPGTDAELRCDEALEPLGEARDKMEWRVDHMGD